MLRPSYSDLLEVITRDAEDETIGSRYTIVIAAAKRARQLVDNAGGSRSRGTLRGSSRGSGRRIIAKKKARFYGLFL